MSNDKRTNIVGGLRITPEDKRDLRLGALYKLPPLEDIPDEFEIGETVHYKDQFDSDLCSGAGVAAASEYQEHEPLDMGFQFMAGKAASGDPIETWGNNLRDALKGAVKIGSLPIAMVPPQLVFNGSNRDIVANHENWADHLLSEAYKRRKSSYFEVIGQYDLFDDIRATMWQSMQLNPDKPQAVITGAAWRSEWTQPDGVVPHEYGDAEFGHCFIFKGVVRKNGELMLKAQLSNGASMGDGGYYYFPRSVVNKEIPPYKAYVFRDIDADVAKTLVRNNLSLRWRWLASFVVAIKNLFHK